MKDLTRIVSMTEKKVFNVDYSTSWGSMPTWPTSTSPTAASSTSPAKRSSSSRGPRHGPSFRYLIFQWKRVSARNSVKDRARAGVRAIVLR
jgi:hypothetical protein